MDVAVVAESVRTMTDDDIAGLVRELPPEAVPALVRSLPDGSIVELVSKLHNASAAKQAVALAIGHHALQHARDDADASATRPARSRRSSVKPRASRAPKVAGERAPGEKRSPQELAALTERTFLFIKSNPSVRMEALSKGLGVETRELSLPIKKLLADKKIRAMGQKRATEYSVK